MISRWTLCIAAVIASFAAIFSHAAEPVRNLTPNCQFKLATPAEGKALLTAEDDYLKSLSRFDLEVRLQRLDGVSIARLKERIAQEVVTWNDADGEKMLGIVDRLRERVAGLSIPWPQQVTLIQTTGREDADAPYTRGQAIILPRRILGQRVEKLEQLFIHELFHILSRSNSHFRQRMYAVIGFQICPEIELPASIRDRKITNPDAPRIDSFQIITQGMDRFAITPVLVSKSEHFDPVAGGTLFKYADFRLLQLEQVAGQYRAKLQDGMPILLEPKDTAGFHAQIGRNTSYIIHPDEVLADNFIHYIFGAAELKSPQIIEGMKRVVQSFGGDNPLR